MLSNNRVKGVKLVRIIALFIILSIFLLNLSSINIYQTNNQQDKDFYQYSDESLEDLQMSDYTSNLEGIGGNLNISLQQSLVDTTLTSIINTTDTTNNTFTVACPTDSDFNSTYTYIEIENIISHNKTIVIEESAPGNGTEDTVNGDLAASFTVGDDLYLENISVFLTTNKNKFASIEVGLYNATWDGSISAPVPGSLGEYESIGNFSYATPKSDDLVSWIEIKGLHYYLNNSLTDNNTWFIAIVETTPPPSAHPSWHYVDDTFNGDNSYAYHHQGGASRNWGSPQPYDFTLIMTFNKAAKSTIPNSAEIGLKINGTDVIGTNGIGTWNSTKISGSSSGKLSFNVSATWEDVECNIKLVQINYTKTNLKASSSFNVLGTGQDILWNVSPIDDLDFFDSRLIRNRINFTIPITWSNVKVFNGSINKTDSISSFSLNNGFKIIQVLNAGNGTNWFLNASSTNLIQSLDTLIESTPVNIINFTDIVNFNVTFSKTIAQNDGTINLSIYSPAVISNKLNYTTAKSTFNEGLQFSMESWDISENVTKCGIFRIQVFWNNNTAAGFLEKTLIIVGRTELTITDPPNNPIYNPSDILNITLYFNDTGADQGIHGAHIDIEVNGSTYTTNTWDIQNGNYKIKINCSDPEFSTLGWYEIKINTSKQFYYNQSEVLTIKIIAAATPKVTIETPSNGSSFDNTANIEINATITDQDGSVSNAKAMINASTAFNISMSFMTGKWTCIWDNTSEYIANDYKITIWAIDDKGNINQTEFVIIELNDVINPNVIIESPTDGSSHDNTANIDINATISDIGSSISNVKAKINATIPFNITMTNIAGKWTYTWNNLSLYNASNYKINIWAIDEYGNINQTEFIITTINDVINPNVVIESPANGSTHDNTANIEINATITDMGSSVSKAIAMINSTAPLNISMNNIAGKWTCTWNNLSLYNANDYKITIWAIDTYGNINQTEFINIAINDVINPNVLIESPSDGSTHDNIVIIEINATITDIGSSVSNAIAMINTTTPVNISMNYITGKWTCTWSNLSLYYADDYKITIWAIDEYGNINQTEFVIITLNDIIIPNVIIEKPSDGSSFNKFQNIEINATINEVGSIVIGAKAMINATIPFNITMNYIAGRWTCTWSNLSLYDASDYKVIIWAIDEYGNINQTEFRIITITDEKPPSVIIDDPSEGSFHDITASVEINATITDDGSVSSARAMINGTTPFNMTMTNMAGKWTCTWNNLSLYDARDYKITIWAIDNNGNINQTEFVIITLNDVINPSVVIETPLDGSSHDNTANIEINVTITDKGGSISKVKAMINTSTVINISMKYIAGKWTCIWDNLSFYDADNYKITIWAIDTNGNINQTEFIIITVNDVINPIVVIETPSDGSSHNNIINIVINATITDDSSVLNAKAMINASTPFNISMIYIAGTWTCQWDNTSEYIASNYKITIWAIDENANINQTEFIIITINDVISPNVIIEEPSDGSSHNNIVNIEINATITDKSSLILAAKAMINTSIPINISMTFIAGKWTCIWGNTSLYDADNYKITIWAIDNIGNVNQTEFVIIALIESRTPSVIIENPSNGSVYDNLSNIEINATIIGKVGPILKVKAMINASIPFNITMQFIAGKWTCTWDNTSRYDADNYKISIWAIDDQGNVNQTESIVISLNDVINPSVTIVTPSNGSSFNNSNIIEINATIIDIGSSIVDVKAMINASTPFNITMLVIDNMWTCTWDNLSLYDAGVYKITIWAIDEGRNINQTEEINIKLFGLTSVSQINMTEYNIIISLNGTIYEAYTGQNITIYANFVDFYQNSLIKGAFGILMFNGVYYYDNDLDNNGLYSWVINTSQLNVNSYEFNVSFSKIFYQNITSKIKFDLNKLLTQITITNQPSTVICGNDCNLTIRLNNLLTGDPIINENVSLLLDFGVLQINIIAKTSAIGTLTYNISIPENATKLDFTVQFLGSEIYTASEVASSVNIINNSKDNESGGGDSETKKKPEEPDLDILVITILLLLGFIILGSITGYVVVTKRTATEKRILIIRNNSQKDLKLIYEVLEKFNLSYKVTEISNLTEITEIDNYSLIVMIGLLNNRGINTEQPNEQKVLIKRALRKNIPVIGVGSGIQILAEYLGENLISYPIDEIGFKHKNTWYTIKLTEESSDDQIFKTINDNFVIFQFYNEKFEVSKDLAILGKIQSLKNQIIRFEEDLYGFQIHFELSEYFVNHFLDNAPELNDYDWNRLKVDYNQIIQSYYQRGKRIFIDYLKLIKLIKDIEIKKREEGKKEENEKHLEKLIEHIEIKTKKSEHEKFTTTNLDDLRKIIDSRIKKL